VLKPSYVGACLVHALVMHQAALQGWRLGGKIRMKAVTISTIFCAIPGGSKNLALILL
jgi:hypothetical protein